MRGSPFFDDVRQIHIEIGGHVAKHPTFCYDGGSMTAAFPARYRKLRELMPDPRYVPARLAPRLGVVAVSAWSIATPTSVRTTSPRSRSRRTSPTPAPTCQGER